MTRMQIIAEQQKVIIQLLETNNKLMQVLERLIK